MKMFPLLLLPFVALAPFAEAVDPQNAFPEGAFEGGTEGWNLPHPNYLKTLGSTMGLESEDGGQFIRITQTKPEIATHFDTVLDIPVSASRVRISYRLRGTDIHASTDPNWAGGFLGGAFRNSEGKDVKDMIPSKRVKSDTAGWLEIEDSHPIPEGALSIRLQPGLYFTTGTLDVDDFQVFFE